MSFNRIMSNGLMGMTAQTHALGTISDNIANARTVGYKRVEAEFENFAVKDKTGRFFEGAGVRAGDRLRMDQSGGLSQTGVTTNAAIVGNGFFLVQDIDSATVDDTLTSAQLTKANHAPELTRAGDFFPDKWGHFVNNSGRALLGERLTNNSASDTPPKIGSLELVSTSTIADYFEGTSVLSVSGNLPGTDTGMEAGPEDGVDQQVRVVDSAGTRAFVNLIYTRTATAADGTSTWDVSYSGATYENGSAVEGVVAGSLGSISFDEAGRPAGANQGDPVNLPLTVGTGFGPITLNLGTVGGYSGLTNVPQSTQSGMGFQQNGVALGSLNEVTLSDDGYVMGNFGEGQNRAFYRIPNAIVINPSELSARSGTTFEETATSGEIQLKFFGNDGGAEDEADRTTNSTSLSVGAVEQSGTRIETEFTDLIRVQRLYSAASKIISTSDEMTQTAVGIKT